MKIWLTDGEGRRFDATVPFEGAPYVEVPLGDAQCPKCNAIKVVGGGKSIESHDTYRADARCVECSEPRGVLRVRVETLFGLHEDEAVLVHGRGRVYRR